MSIYRQLTLIFHGCVFTISSLTIKKVIEYLCVQKNNMSSVFVRQGNMCQVGRMKNRVF